VAIEVQFTPLGAPAALAAEWQALEARADHSFFQSWLWIDTWLHATEAKPLVLRLSDAGRLIGLGLFCERRLRRHGLLPVRQLLLNQTGRPAEDRLEIEYNGLLLARDAPSDALDQAFAALAADEETSGLWQELVLAGVPESHAAAARTAGLRTELDRESLCYGVDLAGLRAAGRSWLDSLSANSRSRVRQSLRHAEAAGPLTLTTAASAAEALDFFDGLIELHQGRWQDRGEAGAFGTLFERNFHHRLISSGVAAGRVELVRIAAGTRILGYLYNFLHQHQVMNYQGGFRYGDDNRDRPGLVAHALRIAAAEAAGLQHYDLLAGDSRYKRSLAQKTESLIWCRVQRPSLAFTLESAARRLKGLARRGAGGAEG